MSKISEEKTKGYVSNKLKSIDNYPTNQNIKVDGITWFKEDSYKGTDYDWLSGVFAKASKKQTLKNKGTPDFVVVKDNSNIIVVIECKPTEAQHTVLSDPKEYKTHGYGAASETDGFAVNGALWYASFLKDDYDVVAIGISGQISSNCKVTSFVWPKGGDITDIEVLEEGTLNNALVSINQYESNIELALHRFAQTESEVRRELRRYTLSCANFLRSNGIEDNSKAGFVSAIILGLTNHDSKLYADTKAAVDKKKSSRAKRIISDNLGRNVVKLLKASLYGDGDAYASDYVPGIWDIDKIPLGKRQALKKYYDSLLSKGELLQAPKGKDKYFLHGDTVLSCCIYSLYENVIEVLERYKGIDVMGEFYTTFLRFTKGNAKEKGIVLTPYHITELFCDIAEFYSDRKFDEKTKIIDICCGTGAFLISALGRIKDNISSMHISEQEKTEKYDIAQKQSLIGVERDDSMYALAYANMRFHGDGKANLFNCSSLLIDSYAPIDDKGKTYLDGNCKIPLSDALHTFGEIDIAMINPPYALDRKSNSAEREYPIILKRNECQDKHKKCYNEYKEAKKKYGEQHPETIKLATEMQKLQQSLDTINQQITQSNLAEVYISKGQDELDFVASMLHYLKEGGIGIAIVPMSCAGSNGTKLRTELLKHHTLLACMTMPSRLFFDSHIGVSTCIMVFKAHCKHNPQKSVFFGIWKEDGFAVIPHNGRKDTGKWKAIKESWIDQLDGSAPVDNTIWIKKKINQQGEALPEAYVKTDYSKITDEQFKNTVRKYSLYKFMDSKAALDIKDSDKFTWLLDNYSEFEKKFSPVFQEKQTRLTDKKWGKFFLGDIVSDIHNGKSYNSSDLVVSDSDDYVFYITRTEQNNGVSMCVQTSDYIGLEDSGAITIGDTTSTIFYQDHAFITGPHMIVIRADWLNVYTANFIISILNMERYRYPVFGRAFTKEMIKQTELYLPIDNNGVPDYVFMEEYIKSLPFSSKLKY